MTTRRKIGICLSGNFNLGKPTAVQMDSVKELCAWLCRKYGLDPTRKGIIVFSVFIFILGGGDLGGTP